MSLAGYYRQIDPGAEVLRGAWADTAGVEFLDRHRPSAGAWESPAPEPQGYFHFFIQGGAFHVNDEIGGKRLKQGLRSAGTVRLSTPQDSVRKTGFGPARCMQVSVTPSALEQNLEDLCAGAVSVAALDPGPRTDDCVGRLLVAHTDMLELSLTGEELYFQILRAAILSRLLTWRLGAAVDPRPSRESLTGARLRRVVDHVDDNLAGSLQLRELAELANISKFHFARAFANTVGMSPSAYVRQRRLHRAARLLASGSLAVREVAARCGYADHAHLTRTFRSHLGVTPSEMRRRFLGKP